MAESMDCALRSVLRRLLEACPGVHTTDQDSGETFADAIETVLSEEHAGLYAEPTRQAEREQLAEEAFLQLVPRDAGTIEADAQIAFKCADAFLAERDAQRAKAKRERCMGDSLCGCSACVVARANRGGA